TDSSPNDRAEGTAVPRATNNPGLEEAERGFERMAEFYAARARGGVGLIVTGGIAPNDEGRPYEGGAKLTTEAEADRHRTVTDAVHRAGGRIAMQILHFGRYAYHRDLVAPSPLQAPISPFPIAVAEKVLDGQGPGAWPVCSVRGGLTRGGDEPDVHTESTRTRPAKSSVRDVQPQTTPQSRAGKAEMYTVVRGDTLSGIAEEHDVNGGWHRLYAANRATVGSDPDLILPGQRLSLTGEAAARTKAGTKAGTKTGTKAKPKAKTKTESKAKPAAETKKAAPRTGHSVVAPVDAPIGTPYHASGSHWSKGYHTGVDFLVPTGTSVKAVEAGQVVTAGWGGSYGYQVVIRHADGRYSQYAHLSAISVRAGQSVSAGQRIGRSGSTGNATGPHLHFEVRTGPGFGSDIDPVAYLRAGGVSI
ncbi:peptidoglycan DD-metalloendopeptidase family protein, partial [Streptomyces sp. NPDC005921]